MDMSPPFPFVESPALRAIFPASFWLLREDEAVEGEEDNAEPADTTTLPALDDSDSPEVRNTAPLELSLADPLETDRFPVCLARVVMNSIDPV